MQANSSFYYVHASPSIFWNGAHSFKLEMIADSSAMIWNLISVLPLARGEFSGNVPSEYL